MIEKMKNKEITKMLIQNCEEGKILKIFYKRMQGIKGIEETYTKTYSEGHNGQADIILQLAEIIMEDNILELTSPEKQGTQGTIIEKLEDRQRILNQAKYEVN